jgi:hypothetical protein
VLLAEVLLSVEQITDSKILVTYVVQEIRFGLLSEPGYVKFPNLQDLALFLTINNRKQIFSKTNLSENEQRSILTGRNINYTTQQNVTPGAESV